MGISPSTAMQLFLQQVQRTRTLPFIVTANQAEEGKEEGKEEGYDEWLRDRLERTIKMLDSGEMKTHTLDEVRSYIRTERAKRRQERGIITNAL
jgi:antitoxin component of RelBE/YafQ-DinJ toxin-antitoxin module